MVTLTGSEGTAISIILGCTDPSKIEEYVDGYISKQKPQKAVSDVLIFYRDSLKSGKITERNYQKRGAELAKSKKSIECLVGSVMTSLSKQRDYINNERERRTRIHKFLAKHDAIIREAAEHGFLEEYVKSSPSIPHGVRIP